VSGYDPVHVGSVKVVMFCLCDMFVYSRILCLTLPAEPGSNERSAAVFTEALRAVQYLQEGKLIENTKADFGDRYPAYR
jgi:hypothetical protein